jgi:hypothetical protein
VAEKFLCWTSGDMSDWRARAWYHAENAVPTIAYAQEELPRVIQRVQAHRQYSFPGEPVFASSRKARKPPLT